MASGECNILEFSNCVCANQSNLLASSLLFPPELAPRAMLGFVEVMDEVVMYGRMHYQVQYIQSVATRE